MATKEGKSPELSATEIEATAAGLVAEIKQEAKDEADATVSEKEVVKTLVGSATFTGNDPRVQERAKELLRAEKLLAPDTSAAGGEMKERRKGLQFKEFRFGENREGDERVMEVKGEGDEEREFFTDVYFPKDLDIESDEAQELLQKMAEMREGVERDVQVKLNREKDRVIIAYKKGKEKFEETENLPDRVNVDDKKDWGRWRNRKIREIRDRIFSEVVFGIKSKEQAEPADKGKAADKIAAKKPAEKKSAIDPITQKGKEIAARIKALEGEEQEVDLEEKEEEAKARIAAKREKKTKEATEKAEQERKAKEEEERGKVEAFEKIEQALMSGDRSKMDEAFDVAEKTVGGVDREKLGNAGVRELEKFILAGKGAEAKQVVEFFKGRKLFFGIDEDVFRARLETERDAAMAKKAEQRAVTIEKAAREIGLELAPPKIMRQAEVERRVRELREKLRHGDVGAKFGKDINPDKIKEIFGREARDGILGVMMANLIKQEEFSVGIKRVKGKKDKEKSEEELAFKTEESAREDVVIDRMLAVFRDVFSDKFTREQCEEMYFAAKSWMLDRAAREKPQGFFARLFRPSTKTGKIVKAGAYLATGVGSTLLTGPWSILITGALRQMDVVGNRVLDEKLANKFRREKGGDLRTNPSTGKLEQTGGDPKFMDELETNLANMLSAEARRSIDNDRLTKKMNLEERTQFYFQKILARPEIANDTNINEEERLGIAQRLAVQYAIDDETDTRREAARGVPDSFWEKVRGQVAHYDPRVGRRTPASERFNTGMAATGIGLGLALVSRADPTGWGRRLFAAYGGWKAGGALYEARYREQKDPMLNLEYRLQEADAQLKALKQAAEAGNWAIRDTREGQLREKLAEAKAVVETFPQDIKFRVRLQEAERRLEELRMELILVEFCKKQDERAYAHETLIERKLATAQAIVGGTTAFDRPRAEAVAREKRALTWKGYGARIAGAAAGMLLAEGAHMAMEEWQKWREAQDVEALRAIREKMREVDEAGKKVAPGAVGVGAEEVGEVAKEAAKTPEQMEADFMKEHGILREQGFDVAYKDGKFIVEADIGKGEGKDFRYLDQALRRITMQEYDFGSKTSYAALDGGRVENSLANLRELIFGHKTGGMIPAEVKDFVHFDAKSGELRIDDYTRLEKYYDDRLFAHADEITNIKSGSLAYVDDTGRGVWQQMLDQKTGDPGHITAENFNRNLFVIDAESRIFMEQANALGLSGLEMDITDEDTGVLAFGGGSEYDGFLVSIDHGVVQTIEVPAGMEDVNGGTKFQPSEEIRLGAKGSGKQLQDSMDAWRGGHESNGLNAEILESATMEQEFAREIVNPLQADAPEGWRVGRYTMRESLTGDVTVFDPDERKYTAKFADGVLKQIDQYQITPGVQELGTIRKEDFGKNFFGIMKMSRGFDDLLRSEAAGGLVNQMDGKAHLGKIEFPLNDFKKFKDMNAEEFIRRATGQVDIKTEDILATDKYGPLARAIQTLGDVPTYTKSVGQILVENKNRLNNILGN